MSNMSYMLKKTDIGKYFLHRRKDKDDTYFEITEEMYRKLKEIAPMRVYPCRDNKGRYCEFTRKDVVNREYLFGNDLYSNRLCHMSVSDIRQIIEETKDSVILEKAKDVLKEKNKRKKNKPKNIMKLVQIPVNIKKNIVSDEDEYGESGNMKNLKEDYEIWKNL